MSENTWLSLIIIVWATIVVLVVMWPVWFGDK